MARDKRETIYIYLPAISSVLWALGGTYWKPYRRFILPVVFLIFSFIYNSKIKLWRRISSCLLAMVAFSLGYGNGHSWLYRFGIGTTYSLSSISYGIGAFQIITPILFFATFYLSNNFFQSVFVWKICEAIVGFSVGLMYAELIVKKEEVL